MLTTNPSFYRIHPDGSLDIDLHEGQVEALDSDKRFVVVLAGAQSGKALAIDTPIPTPVGFVPMVNIRDGDTIYDENGKACIVLVAHSVQFGNRCYRVTFDDGTSVVADAEHLWKVRSAKQRKNSVRRIIPPNPKWMNRHQCKPSSDWSILSTEKMAQQVHDRRGAANYSIDLAGPIAGVERDLPMPPYTLGAWLGDGTRRSSGLTCADEEILDAIRSEGVSVGPPCEVNSGRAKNYRLGVAPSQRNDRGQMVANGSLHSTLRQLRLHEKKRIPDVYFTANESQRLSLLQGLMDTDGYVHRRGRCEFSASNEELANQTITLIRGLGIKARITSRIPTCNGKPGKRNYRVQFTTTKPVFRLSRKLARLPLTMRSDMDRKYVVSITECESVPVRCLTVSSASKLYLCGNGFTPTHNTVIGPVWLWQEMVRRGPGDYFVVAPTYPMLALKALPEFINFFQRTLRVGEFTGSPIRRFVFSDAGARRLFGTVDPSRPPTTVYFGHAGDPESLESATVKAAWLDEAGQKKFRGDSWDAILRRLSIHEGRVLITTTPYNLGWLKQRLYDPWNAANRNHADIDVINFSSIMNPTFPAKEFERARLDLPRWKFDMMYRGRFTRPAGLIYDNFVPEKHTCPRFDIPKTWPRFLGLDFGGINTAGVFFAQEMKDHHPVEPKRWYAYREYYPRLGRTAKEHAEALLKGEPCIPHAVGGAGSEDQWRNEFAQSGIPVRQPPVSEVEVGINRFYKMFANDHIIIFDDLHGLLDELGSYSREIDERGESTDNIEDKETYHHLDACRYLASKLMHAAGMIFRIV